MPGYKRVFRAFPGYDVIANIESVNVLDVTPPGQTLGAGTGVMLLVGEFDNGPFVPTEVFGGQDVVDRFGGLGFATTVQAHDGAVALKSGGDELWNGNSFIWLRNKVFSGLILQRVDNSAGDVAFSRLASLSVGPGPFDTEPNRTVPLKKDGATTVTATFTANPGLIAGSSGTFPTTFSGGETLQLKVDTDATRVITFTAADQTALQCVARINAVLAQTVAVENSGEIDLQSVVRGSAGRIEIVGDSGGAAATLGHSTTVTQQVDTYTATNVTAGTYTLRTALYVSGILTNYDASYTATGTESTTDLRDALLAAYQALDPVVPGVTYATGAGDTFTATGDDNVVFTSTVEAEPTTGDVTIAQTTPPVITVDYGDGNVPNIDSITVADAIVVFDALSGIAADTDPDGYLRVANTDTPATGTLQATSGTGTADFGFDTSVIADADDGEDVTIPVGTRVQDSSASPNNTIWVTMEEIDTGSDGGPFTCKVRPFTDTDTALASSSGNVTVIVDTLPDAFSVTNAAAITRLTASQLDAAYNTAIDKTLDPQTVAYKANMIASARGGRGSINAKLLANAIAATAAGLSARKAIVRPPLGTTLAVAKGATAGIGVGSFRDERAFYVFPGFTTQIPEIQEVGSQAGTGFTDDGVIEVGADSFYASVRSILPPEENAGQNLSDTNVVQLNVLTLEDAYNPDEAGTSLVLADYQSFKAYGIIAPRFSRTSGAIFQSDVTSVDPAIDLVKADANRRFFADFIIDTIGDIALKYVKKLATAKRRRALVMELNNFLRLLQSPNQPDASRLDSFSVTDESTAANLALGIGQFSVKVKMYATLKYIYFVATIGASVTIEEAA